MFGVIFNTFLRIKVHFVTHFKAFFVLILISYLGLLRVKHLSPLIHLAVGQYLGALVFELRLLHPRRHVVGDEGAHQVVFVELLSKQYTIGHAAREMVLTVPSHRAAYHTLIVAVFSVRIIQEVVLDELDAVFLHLGTF